MTTNFKEFALNPALQTSLEKMQFETPTPIQALAIPLGLEGRDILGSAQTGTGKTAAFCVPMVNFLMNNTHAHALVMLPTRELASQVHDVARKMIGEFVKGPQGIKTALLIGGEPIGKQFAQLERRPRLIVGTPGRINDHMRKNPDLVERVEFAVLDEADRMLDMGFLPQIDTILSETALKRQTMMFSATFPDSIIKFSRQYLNNPERISVGVQSKPGENIEQESVFVAQEQKYDELMLQLNKREGSVIVFVRTQHGADKLAAKLNRDEQASEAIHGGLRQRQRDKVLRMFRKGEVRILVATDVAARGLDVPHIEHVVNFDLPQVAEDYIHRIGRTARAGAKGHAVSFIANGEKHLWRDIERMLNPNAANSDKREGGYGKKSFGKKPFGKKPYQKDGLKKPFEKKFGEKKFGEKKFGEKKKWHPDGEFRKPFKKEGFKKREDGDFASNPDSYKKTRFEGENRREGFKQGGFKKPYQKKFFNEGSRDNNERGERNERSERGNRSEGFKKPFKKDGFKKPFRKDGEQRSEGGFKKPFKKNAKAGSFKKPFRREESQQSQGRSERPKKRSF